MKKLQVYFLLIVLVVSCLAQQERCPGLTQCSQMTSIKFKATNDTALKCAALHEGLNCLERAKVTCPASFRITLERVIHVSRTELARLQCDSFAIPGVIIQGASSADSSSINALFFVVFFAASVLYMLQ